MLSFSNGPVIVDYSWLIQCRKLQHFNLFPITKAEDGPNLKIFYSPNGLWEDFLIGFYLYNGI
ncbi:hypothetical protein Q2T41_11980 [Maribacter confluentis]|uniref:BRCT domain-containing protein n=1 Tax=Maribacter confluentis TaxID=1656093 RepID=A0ABT8RTD8_9FLAO|nr:hypothetical protein [Maribacter confluentis]MDO1513376.1 hypothetical protein [Maribacter confluentis]